MYRSILFNCWIALLAFAIAFAQIIYKSNGQALPLKTLLISFAWAIGAFLVSFYIRKGIDYVMYTPQSVKLQQEQSSTEDEEVVSEDLLNFQQSLTNQPTLSSEFQDENSEEIAQVVRTMLSASDPVIEK